MRKSRSLLCAFMLLLLFPVLSGILGCDDLPAIVRDPYATDGDSSNGETDTDIESAADGDAEVSDVDNVELSDQGNTTALPLDENMDDKNARAGIISKDSELLNGTLASGKIGDFKIYNNKVAFVITGLEEQKILAPRGAAIVDAVKVLPSGATGGDYLIEAHPVCGIMPIHFPHDGTVHSFKADSVELIHNGSGGQPAHIRATGQDWPLPPVEKYKDYPTTTKAYITYDYYLPANSDSLIVLGSAKLVDTSDDSWQEAFRPGLAILAANDMEDAYPEMELDSTIDSENPLKPKPDYYALYNGKTSYGFFASNGNKILNLLLPHDPKMVFGEKDMLVEKDKNPGDEIRFTVSDGSVDSISTIVNEFRKVHYPDKANTVFTVSGNIQLSTLYGKNPVEIIVTKEIIDPNDKDKKKIIEVFYSSTFANDDASYSLQLPEGTWKIYTANKWGENSVGIETKVTDSDIPDKLLPSPPLPANITISVKEEVTTGTNIEQRFVAARIDFFAENDHKNPFFTHFTTTSTTLVDKTEELIQLPLGGLSEKAFYVVASKGPFFTKATAHETYKAGPTAEVQGPRDLVIKQVVLPSYVLNEGTDTEKTYIQLPADLNVVTERSLDSTVDVSLRYNNIAAEGLLGFASGETNALPIFTNYMSISIPGTRVEHQLFEISGLGIEPPETAPRYFGIPIFSYLDNGSYNPETATNIVMYLKDNFKAKMTLINNPRGTEASFFNTLNNYDSSNPDSPETYDPHIGLSSLRTEGRMALKDVDGIEIMNGDTNFLNTYESLQDWFSLLSQGEIKVITASSGTKNLLGPKNTRLGWPRNLIITEAPSGTDNYSDTLVDHLKKGHNIVTTGPTMFMHAEGTLPGETLQVADTTADKIEIPVNIKVQAPDWMLVTDLFLCVNGGDMTPFRRDLASIKNNGTRFDDAIPVNIPKKADDNTKYQDSWIVAIAVSGNVVTQDPVYPNTPIMAISNPILIDADGEEGFSGPPLNPSEAYCLSARTCALFSSQDTEGKVAKTKEECCTKFSAYPFCKE